MAGITINWMHLLNIVLDGMAWAVGWFVVLFLAVLLLKSSVLSDKGADAQCFMCKAKLDKSTDTVCTLSTGDRKIDLCERCGGSFIRMRLESSPAAPETVAE